MLVQPAAERIAPLSEADACASEPIHIIAQTQSYGFLIAVSEPDFVVRQVSANVAKELDLPISDIVGGPLERVLDRQHVDSLRRQTTAEELLALNPLRVRFGRPARDLDCIAHRHEGMLLLEFEARDGAYSLEPLQVATHVQRPRRRLFGETTIGGLARAVADEFKRVSGFQRVIVYSFDPDWNGQVIADVGAASSSYLGHHFPASDIPAQARRLFLLTSLRSIADAGSTPVPIVPEINPASGRPLDLSRSILRSASAIHTLYVRNMGLRATMTVSVVVEGELWGMIMAHHSVPYRVDFATRSICDYLGEMFGACVLTLEKTALLQERLKSGAAIEAFFAKLEPAISAQGGEGLELSPLLGLMHADGLVARLDGVSFACGATLSEEQQRHVLAALQSASVDGVASSNELALLDPGAAAYAAAASGALYLTLGRPDEYVLLLRREFVETIVWAGNPHKASDAATGKLHPRTSFESWKETLRGRSDRWKPLELANARTVRKGFTQLRDAQERHRAQERMNYLARYDVLTGLPNRSSTNEFLELCLVRAIREGSRVAVLFIDLDRFKHFNDTLGHEAGDRILQIAASRMQETLRDGDLVGRLGGDEFVAVLSHLAGDRQATRIAARLGTAIAKPFELSAGQTERIMASIGISCYPEDGDSAQALMKSSDLAMYRAKAAGRTATD